MTVYAPDAEPNAATRGVATTEGRDNGESLARANEPLSDESTRQDATGTDSLAGVSAPVRAPVIEGRFGPPLTARLRAIPYNGITAVLALGEAQAEANKIIARDYGFSLRLLGDPILKTPAIDVESLASVEPGLYDALLTEMNRWKGLGMSAQQVGGTQRVCVVRWGEERRAEMLINARILNRSEELERHTLEGCLSVPGFRTSTRRHTWVDVEWKDILQFRTKRARVTGLEAQIVQHEIDHLDGICLVDRVSRQQRRVAERLVAKVRRAS